MERLELGDYARALGKQAATKMALPSEFAGSLGNIKVLGITDDRSQCSLDYIHYSKYRILLRSFESTLSLFSENV